MFNPGAPVSVVMAAADWAQLITILGEHPHRSVDHYIQAFKGHLYEAEVGAARQQFAGQPGSGEMAQQTGRVVPMTVVPPAELAQSDLAGD